MSRRLARFPTVKVAPSTPETVAARATRRPVPAPTTRSPARDGAPQTSQSPLLGWPLVNRKLPASSGGGSGERQGSSSSSSSSSSNIGGAAAAAALGAAASGNHGTSSSSSTSDREGTPPLPGIGDSGNENAPTTPSNGRKVNNGPAAINTSRSTANSSPTSAVDFPTTPKSSKKKTVNSWDPPRLKVVLDMDECLIHSIFDQGVTPGRVAFGRSQSPPPSPPPGSIAPIDSFPLTMLDGAHCLVNKRPRVDWFIEQCVARFDTYVMTAGTRDYAEPLLDQLDPEGRLKGRFYRDSCVFHEGHYFKDLALVDSDFTRVVLVDNNPASFVLCPANGIPVPSFYDDPRDTGLEGALECLLQIEGDKDVRKPLRSMFGLEAKLQPLIRQVKRGGRL